MRWKSNAATSVSSDIPSSHRGRRRISKEERHVLVKSYVHEYRKRNDGKFPTAKDAMQHAGGNYFVVRKIVQELECSSKFPLLKNRTIISAESEQNNVKKSSTEVRKFPQMVTGDANREDVAQELTREHLKRVKEDFKNSCMSSNILEYHKEEEDFSHGTDPNKLSAKKVEQHPTDDLRNQTEKPEESATLETKEHPSQAPPDPEVSARLLGLTLAILLALSPSTAHIARTRLVGTSVNIIDRCWRRMANWARNRHQLAMCSVGFCGKMMNNVGEGKVDYVVTDPGNDALKPKPGTL